MNSCHFLVKIVSQPKERKISEDIFVVESKVKFLKIRKGKKKSFLLFQILLWGNLGKEFLKAYKIGDYIMVRGALFFNKKMLGKKSQKDPKLTVFSVYPFLLTP